MYDEFDQLLSDDLFEEIPKTETLKLPLTFSRYLRSSLDISEI